MRRALVGLALVIVVLVGGTVFAGSADSIPLVPDCKDAPEPTGPLSGGGAGFFHVGHAPDLSDEDPFTEGAKSTIVDHYGYGGLTWSTYDLGCGGTARDPWNSFLTGAANFVFAGPGSPVMLVAMTGQLGLFAMDNPSWWLGIFDHPIESMAAAIRERPFAVFMPLALGFVCLMLMVRHRKMQMSHIASGLFWVVAILAVCLLLLVAPLKTAQMFDGAVQWVSGVTREAFGDNAGPMSSVAPIHEQMLYQTWLAGEFGDADSPTAKKYGPDLFKAQAYTWQEWADRKDTAKFKDTHDRKQREFKETAQKIQDEDRDAYSNLQGRDGNNRMTHALIGAVAVYGACLLLLFSFVMMAVALLEIRAFVVGWPLLAIIGVMPSQRHHLFELWNKLTGAIVRAVVYMASAGIVSILVGAVLAAKETPAYLKVFLILLINGIAWSTLIHWYAKRAVGIGKLLIKYLGNERLAVAAGRAAGKAADRVPSDDRGGSVRGPGRAQRETVVHEAMQPSAPPAVIPRPGTGWKTIEHPGYWVREPTVRAPRLTTGSEGFDIGESRIRAPGLPVTTRALSAVSGGVEPIDVVSVADHDGEERYVVLPRTTTRHRPLAIEERAS